MPQANGGALLHLAGDPILLPGDDVILLLRRSPENGTGAQRYSPLNHVGVYYVRAGLVYTPKGNPCASVIDGTPLPRVLAFIRSAVERTATAPISSTPSCGQSNAVTPGSSTPTVAPTR